MKADAKRYITGLLDTGHKHEAMSGMLACEYCGDKFKKAEKEYNRLRREKPELFTYKKPEYPDSPEYQKQVGMLADRLKKDKLYKEHIRLSFFGTEQEKTREDNRANTGYYKRFYEEDGNIKDNANN